MSVETAKNSSDPRVLAVLAHLSIIGVFFLGPFTIVIPFLVWFFEKRKSNASDMVVFQAKQALFYQLAAYTTFTLIGIMVKVFIIVFFDALIVPLFGLLGVGLFMYGVYGGILVAQGKDFRYILLSEFLSDGHH